MNLFGRSATSRLKLTELSMTPLIDCVFLLLLFFMVSMKFKEIDRRIEAQMPKGPITTVRPPINELFITIRNAGTAEAPRPQLLLDRRPMRNWAALRAALRDHAAIPGGTRDTVIVVPTDDAAHGWVMNALDLLTEFGYRNVSFKR